MPIVIPDIPFIGRRRRPAVMPAATGLTLVSAVYESTIRLTLTFNRAIDLSAFDGSAVTVDDGDVGFRYAATGGTGSFSGTSVELILEGVEELPLVGITMTATGANGIVDLDGTAWAGVTELGLPFP